MNRLKDLFESQPDPEPETEYFEIEGLWVYYVVSRATAIEIERRLDQRPPPRWIVFHDLAGARHRVLTESIREISESTAAQRAIRRAFRRARKLEEKADRRPWEDDDDLQSC